MPMPASTRPSTAALATNSAPVENGPTHQPPVASTACSPFCRYKLCAAAGAALIDRTRIRPHTRIESLLGNGRRLPSMTRLLIALVTAAALSQAPAPAGRLLTIDFVALDRDGMPVPDLKPGEVEVWIGQFRAPVRRMTVVTPEADERDGRLFVLLLDDITLRLDAMPRARDVARRLVMKMAANDRMAVLTLTGTHMDTTADQKSLLRAIDAYSVRATAVMRSDTLGREVLGTLAQISAQLIEVPGRRKTI